MDLKFLIYFEIFGSSKKILIFNILAARHNGIDIYPPVEIRIRTFSLFKRNKDFKVKRNTFGIAKENKKNLFSLGVLTTKVS